MSADNIMIITIILIVIMTLVLVWLIIHMIAQNRTVKEGTVKGKCINKYTGQTGSVGGSVNDGHGSVGGTTWTNFFITLEFKNGARKTYRCKDEIYGIISIGENAIINYRILGNGQRWIKKLQVIK